MALSRQARTERIIDTFRGLPGEFYMLKGLLCLDMYRSEEAWSEDSEFLVQWRDDIDGMLVAARMDEIRHAQVAA